MMQDYTLIFVEAKTSLTTFIGNVKCIPTDLMSTLKNAVHVHFSECFDGELAETMPGVSSYYLKTGKHDIELRQMEITVNRGWIRSETICRDELVGTYITCATTEKSSVLTDQITKLSSKLYHAKASIALLERANADLNNQLTELKAKHATTSSTLDNLRRSYASAKLVVPPRAPKPQPESPPTSLPASLSESVTSFNKSSLLNRSERDAKMAERSAKLIERRESLERRKQTANALSKADSEDLNLRK